MDIVKLLRKIELIEKFNYSTTNINQKAIDRIVDFEKEIKQQILNGFTFYKLEQFPISKTYPHLLKVTKNSIIKNIENNFIFNTEEINGDREIGLHKNEIYISFRGRSFGRFESDFYGRLIIPIDNNQLTKIKWIFPFIEKFIDSKWNIFIEEKVEEAEEERLRKLHEEIETLLLNDLKSNEIEININAGKSKNIKTDGTN